MTFAAFGWMGLPVLDRAIFVIDALINWAPGKTSAPEISKRLATEASRPIQADLSLNTGVRYPNLLG